MNDFRQIVHPAVVGIYGKTKAGKTTFAYSVLKQRDRLFRLSEGHFRSVWIFYGCEWDANHADLQTELQKSPEIEAYFKKGFLDTDVAQLIKSEQRPALVLIDDLEQEISTNRHLQQAVNVDSHHADISLLLVFQSLFPGGKNTVNLQRQFDCYVFFNYPTKSGIQLKFTQLSFNGELAKKLAEVWARWTERPGGYMLLDFHPQRKRSEKLFFAKTGILSQEPLGTRRMLRKKNESW